MTLHKSDWQLDRVFLGTVVGAQGLGGQLRIKTCTEDAGNLTAYGSLFDDQGRIFSLKIDSIKSQTLVIAVLNGCSDRNQAEALVGTKLYVNRDQLPSVAENEFYYHDLIGMTVLDEQSQFLGSVKNVANCGAGDFLEIVDEQQRIHTLPFSKEAIPVINTLHKKLFIQRRFLLS